MTETRNVTREKYSELKLLGNFAKVSPSYLLATPSNLTTSTYANTADLTVTPLKGDDSTSYYVARHSNYSSQASTPYKLKLPTSAGDVTIPQLGGDLSLNGRDSKIHVADYNVSGTMVVYSTAEIFTWKKFADSKVLIVYGGPGEHHELAVASESKVSILEGTESDITSKRIGNSLVMSWDVSSNRRIVQIGDLRIFLIDRNSAYNYWVPELPTQGTLPGYSTQGNTASSIIIKAGYLVRTAYLKGSNLCITADFNATTEIEVIGAPKSADNLYINGEKASREVDRNGIWTSQVEYAAPEINLPSLKDLEWKYLDTLPEIQSSYDDSAWPIANKPTTDNTLRPLDTPTSLYSSDYGFHAGYLIYRGSFVAQGNETKFFIRTQGGQAFGSSLWLSQTLLGSWTGLNQDSDYNATYTLPQLQRGQSYVITVVVDNTGLDEDWTVGTDEMKNPRGILNYRLSGRNANAITWKLTGNLGGEDYHDKTRGPLNEGGLYAERHGFHQPEPPSADWKTSSPLDGLSQSGIGLYSTKFDLDIPRGWDVPLYFNFGNSSTMDTDSSSSPAFRVQLYVNGYQYGKYVSNIGPQTSFPVPEGILNHRGTNWIAVSLWALESGGARLDSFELSYETPIKTGMKEVEASEQPGYEEREGAY